jgi:hypothetical protein
MRFMFVAVAVMLASCSPPANQAPARPSPRLNIACNDLAPNPAGAVALDGEIAAAIAVADLRGGRIAPGIYDLVSGARIGMAAGWEGARAVAIEVREDESGTMFNWANAAPDGAVERWTAGFIDAPTPHLTYVCGRSGGADIAFTAEGAGLRLQLPEDGGAGSLYLVFLRRA